MNDRHIKGFKVLTMRTKTKALCFVLASGVFFSLASARAQLTLPFSGSDSGSSAASFTITKTGSGRAGLFVINNASSTAEALFGQTNGIGTGGTDSPHTPLVQPLAFTVAAPVRVVVV